MCRVNKCAKSQKIHLIKKVMVQNLHCATISKITQRVNVPMPDVYLYIEQ